MSDDTKQAVLAEMVALRERSGDVAVGEWIVETIAALRDRLASLERELAEAEATHRAEVEAERLRLAACGVAAMQNTPASIAERITRDNPYWSASYGDVCAAVDREMALRAEVERAFAAGYKAGNLACCLASAGHGWLNDTAAWSRYQQERQ